jgi:Domain of unknown function (DUF4845)
MGKLQRGIGLIGLILVLVVVIVAALFTMKLVPSFLEYRSAKVAIEGIARQNPGTPGDVRKAFQARATIDDINTVRPEDLEITKEGNSLVISFAYRKEVPLFANVGMYIDYVGRAGGQ